MQGRVDTDPRKVVPKTSATLDGYTSIGIHANHMEMTKFSSKQDPDYRNVLSELRRFIEPGQHQPRKALALTSSESSASGTQRNLHGDTQNEISSAGKQDPIIVHEKTISGQPTGPVNTFSGNFNTGGGKMFQGGSFNSGGGPMNF